MLLLTGAAGHLGCAVAKLLCAQGLAVRVLLLPGEDVSHLAGLPLCRAYGDVCDPETVREAVHGCSAVLHLAGVIDISTGQSDTLYRVNVNGTKNVVEACLREGVERLVYVSSVHSMPVPPAGTALRERKDFPFYELFDPYARSKSMATAAVYGGIARGLDAVVLFPSGIVGPEDFKLSAMGRTFRYAMGRVRRRMMWSVNAGYNFVDVRDVAGAVVTALEKGQKGEGYLITGHDITVDQIFGACQGRLGAKPKFRHVSVPLMFFAARMADLWARLRKKPCILTPYSVEVLLSNRLMDGSKAEAMLGYRPRPLAQTLADTMDWTLRRLEQEKQAKACRAGRRKPARSKA